MKTLLSGLALLPFLTAVAVAQPMQLSENQMDVVTAGFTVHEIDITNTSWTEVAVWTPLTVECGSCYLKLTSPALSVQSAFGPLPNPAV